MYFSLLLEKLLRRPSPPKIIFPPLPQIIIPCISLLPLISKVYERQYFYIYFHFCISLNILSNAQFGFHPGHSTETAILSVLHYWYSHLDLLKPVCAVSSTSPKPLILFPTSLFCSHLALIIFLLTLFPYFAVTYVIAHNK